MKKENKIFHIIILSIILITLFLILFVHIFNTSDNSNIDLDAVKTCPIDKKIK